MRLVPELLGDIHDAYVLGDRAYDAASLEALLKTNGCAVVIPSNSTRAHQRQYDRHLYRDRWLIENLFQKLKRHRRVAMRFEKLAKNYLGFLYLACVLVWLR